MTDDQKRKANAERQRRHREKVKKELAARQAAEEDRSTGEWRIKAGLRMIGELLPMVDCTTIADAIVAAKEWGAALGITDLFTAGTTLHDAERRIYNEWHRQGRPLMRPDGTLDPRRLPEEKPTPFNDAWILFEGADTPSTAAETSEASPPLPVETRRTHASTPDPPPGATRTIVQEAEAAFRRTGLA
jgi:hypothetical protein